MPESHPTSRTRLEEDMKRFGLSSDAIRMLDADIEWVTLFRRDQVKEAYTLLYRAGLLPEMMSYIRANPHEPVDFPLFQLQYMIAWTARDSGLTGIRVPVDATGLRIAVVGGGPTGLAAAVRLLEKGHTVDLYEREQQLGGAPALVYCEERLPDPADEINALLKPAMQAGRLTVALGRDVSSDMLMERYDTVLLATGCWNEPSLGSAAGVWPALRFLKEVRSGQCTHVPVKVTLLCGGDAAMDAAVAAKKLGAKRLTLLFDCPRGKAHWHLPDSWFDTEGVEVRYEVHPVGYRTSENGAVSGVLLKEDETVETEMVIEAMGLYADKVNTQVDGLFAAGALVNGGASVRQCVQEGFDAAEEIDRFLKGKAA